MNHPYLIVVVLILALGGYLYPKQVHNFGGTVVAVFQGGTGATTYGQGWLNTSGGTSPISASTSPTVNYVTATSTNATSTFSYGLQILSGCLRLPSGACAGSGTGNGNVTSVTTSLFAGTIYATTTSIVSGGLTLGTCDTTTSTVPGASMSSTTVVDSTPQTYPGDGVVWESFVTNATTVVTKECGLVIITPVATKYNLVIFQ